MKTRHATLAAAILFGCTISSMLGCQLPETDAGINVVLISIDTTRADHLGAYGHPDAETPNIDRLAAEGVLFEHCGAPAPITLPSHASMLTGTLPFVHGVRDNGNYRLHDDNQTLAEALSDNGYATGAHVGVFILDKTSGLSQGFTTYQDPSGTQEGIAGPESANIESPASAKVLRADIVADNAILWLQQSVEGKFFLFVHFFDPHAPYDPPEPFSSRFDKIGRAPETSRYLGEIAYVDQQIGRLLQTMGDLSLMENTLIILTADHGEAFGEHRETGHTYLVYDTTVEVPLVIRPVGGLPKGRRIVHQVRTIDIAPTIVDLVGLSSMPIAQGVSLRPYIEDQNQDLGLAAYTETLAPFLDFRYSPLRGLRNDRWKYILAPEPELYDLQTDAGEERNVHDANPAIAERMKTQLRDLVTHDINQKVPGTGNRNLSPEDVARLRSLGYVSQSSPDATIEDELATFEFQGPDPKHRIELMVQASRAMHALLDGEAMQAELLFRELVEADQESVFFRAKLAESLFVQEKMTEAAELYHQVVILDANHVKAHQRLAHHYLGLSDFHTAADHLRELARLLPEDPAVHMDYGRTSAILNEFDNASSSFRRVLDIDPSNVDATVFLARIAILQRRYLKATELLETAIEQRPDSSRIVLQLAWLRATCQGDAIRDGEKSLELAERAIALQDHTTVQALIVKAAALAETGRFDEAVVCVVSARELAIANQRTAPLAERAIALEAHFRERQPYRTDLLF